MAFDRKDGNAMFDLPTDFGIAMIEAPWAVRTPGLASQTPAPARTSNTSPSSRLRFQHACFRILIFVLCLEVLSSQSM